VIWGDRVIWGDIAPPSNSTSSTVWVNFLAE